MNCRTGQPSKPSREREQILLGTLGTSCTGDLDDLLAEDEALAQSVRGSQERDRVGRRGGGRGHGGESGEDGCELIVVGIRGQLDADL